MRKEDLMSVSAILNRMKELTNLLDVQLKQGDRGNSLAIRKEIYRLQLQINGILTS